MADLGRIYTRGSSFRARAEARQREYRAHILGVEPGKYGHHLENNDAEKGLNFVVPTAFQAAKSRQSVGKGVADQTFNNMLSSQAMCFNLFAPLQTDRELACGVLSNSFPDLDAVNKLVIEHTPENDVFGDQTGRGGVDCDVLIEGVDSSREPIVIVIETKFVETEFSICGFRKSGRPSKGLEVCADDILIASNTDKCLYAFKKNYRYWERSIEHNTLAMDRFPVSGCPFAGPLWQLWTNHTLAHAEAAKRDAKKAIFAVCAPSQNEKLLQNREILEQFRYFLNRPESMVFISLDEFLQVISKAVMSQRPQQRAWIDSLVARYAEI